jgi:hypothetical protein
MIVWPGAVMVCPGAVTVGPTITTIDGGAVIVVKDPDIDVVNTDPGNVE